MSHEANAELVSAYLDGQLRPDEAERFERLLEEDESVRQHVEGMRSMISNLAHLERMAPPPTLGQDVARRIALAGEQQSLMDRIEDSLADMKTPSSVFLMFAVIFALSVIVFFFAMGLEKSHDAGLTVNLSPESDGATEMSPGVLEASTVLVGNRLLVKAEDGRWLEDGLEPEQVASARLVDLESDAGRALLEAKPDLRGIAMLGHALVMYEGEVLELCTLPHDEQGQPELATDPATEVPDPETEEPEAAVRKVGGEG